MGCRNRDFLGQESAAPSSLGDALLFTTMCIIGLPVDVHVKDGSIYSGIFHTACVENDFGIVLKKARMTKKGDSDANVAIGDLIETLVVVSEDLVQVVAKAISLPANGVSCNDTSNGVGDVAGSIPSLEYADRGVKVKKSNKKSTDRLQTSQTRQVGDVRAHGKRFDYKGKSDFEKVETRHEVLDSGLNCELNSPPDNVDASSTPSKVDQMAQDISDKLLHNDPLSDRLAPPVIKMRDQCKERHPSEDSSRSNAISLAVSTSGTSFVEGTKESFVSSSATPAEMVLPKSSSATPAEMVLPKSSSATPAEMVPPKSSSSTPAEMVRPKSSIFTAKASKLNAGAEVFCPLSVNHRSLTPPAVPTVTSVAYIPDNFPMVPIPSAQPEVEISPYVTRSSLPAKFAPYGNLTAGNGVSDSQYSQSIIAHVGSRTQPNRYVAQQHTVQAGPAYMQPNSQNVMVGRLGAQLVYMHPVTHDVNQGMAVFSQVGTRPLVTQHQGHLLKHQGNAAAQTLQLYVNPPYIAGGQQQFAVQSHIPLPQPPFPVIRPIPGPGSNGFFSTKFQ